jgi:predicted alpha-1,2-mannosidase
MNLTSYIDPFHGNGAIDLPPPQGIAAAWFFIKAQTGNTHPGACLPFGMVSACAYSGAYISGYGLNAPNTHARAPRAYDDYTATGFSHFQHSGTGAIGTYYNYARVTPLQNGLAELGRRWTLREETARPGYYAATLGESGIRAELTVSRRAAMHRYTIPGDGVALLALDLSAGGIQFPKMGTRPTRGEMAVLAPNAAQGMVVMAGFPLYVYAEAQGATGCSLWVDRQESEAESLAFPEITAEEFAPFGWDFAVEAGQPVELRVAFSLVSYEQAQRNLTESGSRSFEQIAAEGLAAWEECCQRVVVEGGTAAQRQIFYSCLYHSLVKPADFSGECPFWEDAPFYVDFATLWDQYKTQLPLMLSLYPEWGAPAVNAMLRLAEHLGGFPNGLVLNDDWYDFENQARSLFLHTIADAFHRRLEGIDWRRALHLMAADIRRPRNADFLATGTTQPSFTHALDLADACACTAYLARALGEETLYEEMAALAGRWRNVYDPATGRLGASNYYEGGAWNYSFRLLHDMGARIGLYPNEAAFVADLDAFFGYGQPPVRQAVLPTDRETMAWGFSLNRFEGLNNEPDMETPYAYIYAGRHDRTAEVVRAGMRDMFATGRGGLPGNDDSGGTSSWYVWNAVGLFPVAGKPFMLIGSPIFDAATLRFGNAAFRVEAVGNSDDNIYIQRATLNGQPLERAYLTLDEVLAGGTLRLEMGGEPSAWAQRSRPPKMLG